MIGLAEWNGEQVQIYENEYDIPDDFPRGANVAFESPVVMSMGGQPGIDDAMIVRVQSNSAVGVPYLIVVPRGVTAEPSTHPTILSIQPGEEEFVFETMAIVAICVMIAVAFMATAFIYGQWVNYQKSLLVAHSGDITGTYEDDLNGDGTPDVRTTTYQNGRVVSQAISDYGVASGVSVNPTMTVDPTWTPDDLNFGGLGSDIMTAVKYGIIGVTAIGVLYLGAQAYSSIKNKRPFQAPAFERAVSGATGVAQTGAGLIGRVAA